MGFLYMEDSRFVVLLNNVAVERADLGPLQSIRHEHIDPEADILILPRGQVRAIDMLQVQAADSPEEVG
jgi:hypothetical protein